MVSWHYGKISLDSSVYETIIKMDKKEVVFADIKAKYLLYQERCPATDRGGSKGFPIAAIFLVRYAGNDWSLSAQYAHKYVSIGKHRNSGLATFRISKDLFHNTLALQSFAYIDVTNGSIYNRLSADYALNDQLHAIIGYDYFHADRGMFTVYDKNSELFFKLKYSF